MKVWVLSCLLLGSVALAQPPLDQARLYTVQSTIANGQGMASIRLDPQNTLPGTAREYSAPLSGGSLSHPVSLFPGDNKILIEYGKFSKEATAKLEVKAPEVRVELRWAGKNQDYDLYVKSVNYQNTDAEGGKLDQDWISEDQDNSDPGVENITFAEAEAGLYNISVNYYHDNEDGNDDGQPDGSPQATTVNVFVDGVSVYTATRTISKYDYGASFWGVGTLVIHSGEETGGYMVNPSTGLRDILPQSEFLNEIDPHGDFEVDEIGGPNGTDDVYMLVGQSAQFELTGTVNVGTENEERYIKIIGDFDVSDNSLAIVDETGVLTGIAPGTVEVRSVSDNSKKVTVHLLPVELISDLNNDGQITAADNPLRDAAMASGATDEIKDKGTEFIFHNDTLSNGTWDKEDTTTPGKPADADDDDAEPILVNISSLPDQTQVWLEHPASAGLKYYRDRKCTQEIPLSSSQRHVVGGSVAWPTDNKLFMRADGTLTYPPADPQFAGDLILKIKGGTNGQEIEAVKMKLTVVKQLGAKKYFHAARDYMFERNSGKFIHDWGYPVASPAMHIRMCNMLEEKAFMQTIEASHKPVQEKGISAVMASRDYLDVLINGNLVFFSNPDYNDWLSQLSETHGKMTDLCNGRIVEAGVNSPASRDETPVISGLNPTLAGPDARYVLQATDGKFTFGQGRVPLGADEQHAIGGLHTDYNSGDATSWPIQMIGYGKALETVKGVVFTATGRSPADTGKGPEFKAAAEQSGVPSSPGGRIQLFFCDFGQTSPALAHSNPDGALNLIWKGNKHNGINYYVNTYVGFIAPKPR